MIIHVFIEELRIYKTSCTHTLLVLLYFSTTTTATAVVPFTAKGAIKLVVAFSWLFFGCCSFLCVNSHLWVSVYFCISGTFVDEHLSIHSQISIQSNIVECLLCFISSFSFFLSFFFLIWQRYYHTNYKIMFEIARDDRDSSFRLGFFSHFDPLDVCCCYAVKLMPLNSTIRDVFVILAWCYDIVTICCISKLHSLLYCYGYCDFEFATYGLVLHVVAASAERKSSMKETKQT